MNSRAFPAVEFEQATQPANDVAEGLSPAPSAMYEVGKRAIDLIGSSSLNRFGGAHDGSRCWDGDVQGCVDRS